MYQCEEITLNDLLPFSGEPSYNALRARAGDGILVFIRANGASQYFDKLLSLIRCKSARSVKGPGITWGKIARAFKTLDAQDINGTIIARLNAGETIDDLIRFVQESIRREL